MRFFLLLSVVQKNQHLKVQPSETKYAFSFAPNSSLGGGWKEEREEEEKGREKGGHWYVSSSLAQLNKHQPQSHLPPPPPAEMGEPSSKNKTEKGENGWYILR